MSNKFYRALKEFFGIRPAKVTSFYEINVLLRNISEDDVSRINSREAMSTTVRVHTISIKKLIERLSVLAEGIREEDTVPKLLMAKHVGEVEKIFTFDVIQDQLDDTLLMGQLIEAIEEVRHLLTTRLKTLPVELVEGRRTHYDRTIGYILHDALVVIEAYYRLTR